MKLINEKEMSEWIWNEVIRKKNSDKNLKQLAKEYVENIRGSREAYLYCTLVEDDPIIRSLIKESYWAYMYCTNVKDDEIIRSRITDSEDAYWYCIEVNRKDSRLNDISKQNPFSRRCTKEYMEETKKRVGEIFKMRYKK